MKILHVISSVNPEGGGPIEGVKQLASILERRGHSVDVVSLDPPESIHVKTFPRHVTTLGAGVLNYRYNPVLVPWLKSAAPGYDAVVVNGLWGYHSFACWRALHNSSIPYYVFTHGMLDPWFKETYPLKHLKKWAYWPWAEYRVLRDAKAVLFTCEEERLLARRSFWLYKANEAVVNYGTSIPDNDGAARQKETFLQMYPGLRGKKVCLFMGRIHPKKGCDLAISSFARVLAKKSEWCLVMAGPDQVGLRPKLEALARREGIADMVTWTGMIGGETKWGAIRAAEVLLLPSHQENFGIVVAEALGCGVPALLSNKVNIWREVAGDGAGIVAGDDLDGATSTLNKWEAMTSAQQKEMRARALACFSTRFEISKAAATLLETLQKHNQPEWRRSVGQ